MEKANATVRIGGSIQHTVFKIGLTPAEVLILQRINGADAVVDIRPTGVDSKVRQEEEWNRLADEYDSSSAISSRPGEERVGLMSTMFPGAIRKLPTTFAEIGLNLAPLPDAPKKKAKKEKPAKAEAAPVNEADQDYPEYPVTVPSAAETAPVDGDAEKPALDFSNTGDETPEVTEEA